MPRFRFQWQHIPHTLREILALSAELPGTDADHFVKKFGKRPTIEFIKQQWPILLDHWLVHDVSASARIALALRQHELGDPAVADDIAYLHTCRNTQRLREVVLLEFITYGERTANLPEHSPASPPPPPQVTNTGAPTAPTTTTSQDPIEVLRQNLITLLQKNFPKHPLTIQEDGDISMNVGSSMLFLSIVPDPLLVRVFAVLLKNVQPSPDLYETLNHINHQLQIGRIFAINNVVILESAVLPYALNERVLLQTVNYIALVADDYDDRLQRTFGGELCGVAQAGDMIDV